jgi:hypothetical protein
VITVAIDAGPAAMAPATHEGPILPIYSLKRPSEIEATPGVDVSSLMIVCCLAWA